MASLYEVITAAAQSGNNKRKVGYTVGAYAGVLSSLQKTGVITASSAGGSGDGVLGTSRIDWESTASATYDDSGFSSNVKSGLWRMAMKFHGAIPISITSSGAYEMLCLPGDTEDSSIKMDGLKRWCPYVLSPEAVGACTQDNFSVGAYIDLSTLGVKYFNHFYSNATVSFDQKKVSDIVAGGYLMAQVTFVEQKKFKLVKVLGQMSINNSAAISLTLPIIGTSQWKDVGTQLNVIENGKDKKGAIPATADYKFACDGNSYDSDNGIIKDFNKNSFNSIWLPNSSDKKADAKVQLALEPIPITNCLVRLYVPSKFKSEVVAILGGNPNEFLFQEQFEMEYVEAQADQYSGNACANANTAEMLKCIETVCNNNGCMRFPHSRMGTKGCYGSTKWVNHDLPISTAMAGKFVIPSGWPMCPIANNYTNRHGGGWPQSRKGHPGGANADWVYCMSSSGQKIKMSDRMDSAISNLTSKILQGDMPPEWYRERLVKANAGTVVIHCNSRVASKMQNFFNMTWNLYKAAADLYNQGKAETDKVSTGELMLRCAPSICSWNGFTPFHRNRKSSKQTHSAGHDAGAGIDFAYHQNREVVGKARNCQTDIGSKCDGAYRPMLHALYTNGGGWGGEYPFMGKGKYDAMHVQFN